MAQAENITINNTEYKLANNGKRLAAGLIDIAIMMIPGILVTIIFYIIYFVLLLPIFIKTDNGDIREGHGISEGETLLVFIFVSIFMYLLLLVTNTLIFWIYHSLIAYKQSGKTYGKKIMNLTVIDQYGQTPSLKALTIRTLVTFGLNIFTNSLHYITILVLEKRQGLYDMAAKTYVVEDLV